MSLHDISLSVAAFVALSAGTVSASVISTHYGDDDGFGIGRRSGALVPLASNAGVGEAPFTDIRLVGGPFANPSFRPTGGFDPFVLDAPIIAAKLTLRAGALDTRPTPLDGPGSNVIMLDGLAVPASFFVLFTANTDSESRGGDAIETRSIALGGEFFALFADGLVSLIGSNISERVGSGSFQVDFLRLDIVTGMVPEPSTLLLAGVALLVLLYKPSAACCFLPEA